MFSGLELLEIPQLMLDKLDLVWSFMLLLVRYVALLLLTPGIGMGFQGLAVRMPAALILACTSLIHSTYAQVPLTVGHMLLQLGGELLFGTALALIPLCLVSGVQAAGQISSSTMGLGASQLIDPTVGAPTSDVSRIMGDLTVIVFMLLGGHHVLLYAASGYGSSITPGSFIPTELTTALLVERSGAVFGLGVILSLPVVVALLLTQFVMGLLSRAVPTVNIFIISFPLTIGIGLILTVLSLPELVGIVSKEVSGIEAAVDVVLRDTHQVVGDAAQSP
jgi:flagellar biosynthetic protein FliR